MTKNQELFLTQEQVSQLSKAQAEKHLKKLERAYPLDKPFAEIDNFPELWAQVDDITNTLLWLEDHIARCDMLVRVSNAGSARWTNKTE